MKVIVEGWHALEKTNSGNCRNLELLPSVDFCNRLIVPNNRLISINRLDNLQLYFRA